MKIHNRRKLGQDGLAAFIIVFMLMLIITLLVLGYAKLVRQSQQQTLDRNLSTRAFYAAESGVNMVAQALKNNPALYAGAGKTSCDPDASVPELSNFLLDGSVAAPSAEVSCLTVDTSPNTLEYSSLPNQQSQVIPLRSTSSFNAVSFNWQSTSPSGGYGACTAAMAGTNPPDDGSWNCNAPLLRVDIVPSGGAAMTRNSLQAAVSTFFVYPATGAANGFTTFGYVSGTGNARGAVTNGVCNTGSTPLACRIIVNGLPAGTDYTARVYPMYGDMRLSVCAISGVGNACNVQLQGAQVVVDSTGKALDVVRRVQVRLSLSQPSFAPSFALAGAAGLCKRYEVLPPANVDATAADGSPVTIGDPDDPCG